MENKNVYEKIIEMILPFHEKRIIMYISIPNTEFFDTYFANLMFFTVSEQGYRKYHAFSSRDKIRPETFIGSIDVDLKEACSKNEYFEDNVEEASVRFLHNLKTTMVETTGRGDFFALSIRNPRDENEMEFKAEESAAVMHGFSELIFLSSCKDKALEVLKIESDSSSKSFGGIRFSLGNLQFVIESTCLPDVIKNERLCLQLKNILKKFNESVSALVKLEGDILSNIDDASKLLLEMAEENDE